MDFAHLHVHTEYSLLDGSNKIKEYVARVKELGMTSAAITDHGVMYGVIDFYKEAKKAGINPIIGCEVYVAPGSRFDRETTGGDDRYYHLVLLAENNTGYSNLMKIVSKGFVEGFYYKPRVDKEVLREYHEGIIALSACLAGEIQRYLVRGLYDEAKQAAFEYQDIFGQGNFFLELQDHGLPEQANVNQRLIHMSKETGIELVATNDVHYTYADDEKSHDILLCIQTGKKLTDENRMRYEGGQYYVKSTEEMAALFPYALNALENTGKIAARCNVEIEFGNTKLPKFDVPDGMTSVEYLRKLCNEGLVRRYPDNYEELKTRLEYELGVIEQMGYVDYFLIVWDFIRFSKENGIMVGPGRGSAAGSIVSYCLGITNIDPLKYNLLFERFLNPERVSMPDIDIDFCYERRQEVIDYVVKKYGKDRVVQIVTFGTLAARGVIRDVGRVMDIPYARVDTIAKMIPNELGITIDKALEKNHELRSIYNSDDEIKELIDMSKRLEGLPRHTSMHAAGVVISQKSVDEYVPLSRASDGSITTQFTMTTLEELGLLKMDFLGLRTLTVIRDALDNIKKARNIDIDIDNIDYNDKKVLDYIGSGKTEGIFQLESAGMKAFMRELMPQSLEDIIAGISLYRPGPMDFIPSYIKGKNDASKIHYDCPQLESILSPTYGCIVYQEQVMQIVRDLAGYTMGRSDLVRRAMAKKKADVMQTERMNFVYGNEKEGVKGCIANGIDEKIGNKIYDDMIDFAKYAFNKSHAAAYAIVSYQTAYLKFYYPVEYMAALMTSVIDNTSKVASYILHCKQMGIEILPPDINYCERRFSVKNNAISFALSAVKGVGGSVIDSIVEERERNGHFRSLKDFIERMADSDVNKRLIENMIKVGAFSGLDGTRKQHMQVYAQIYEEVNKDKKNSMAGQMSLFDFVSEEEKKSFEIKLPDVGEFPKEVLLAFEKEIAGVYISGHPLDEYVDKMGKVVTKSTLDFQINEETNQVNLMDGEKVTVGGIVTDKVIKFTKSNQRMAFITLEDLFGTVEVIVFAKIFERNEALFGTDNKIFIKGHASLEDDKNARLICEQVYSFDDTKKELWIKYKTKEEYVENEHNLLDLLKESDGNDDVVIYVENPKAVKRLPSSKNIMITDELISSLKANIGEDNIRIVEKGI